MFRKLHKHVFSKIELGSGFGRAKALRFCDCGEVQTYMFDSSIDEHVWVKGNFIGDPDAPIFVIANTSQAFHLAVEELTGDEPDDKKTPVRWLVSPHDVIHLKQSYRWPRIHLAEDWSEADILFMEEIRILLQTGHIE